MNEVLENKKEIKKTNIITKATLVLIDIFILYFIGHILSLNLFSSSSNLNFITLSALIVLSFLFLVIFLPVLNINISFKKILIVLFIVLFISFMYFLILPAFFPQLLWLFEYWGKNLIKFLTNNN